MNSLLCFTCDSVLNGNTTFYLFQCNCCKQKTSYCLLCQKVLAKLFSGLLFKCAQCNTINRTETMELVEREEESNQKSFLNNTCYDNHKIFSSSLIQNDSCIKGLFGNSFNQSVNHIDLEDNQTNLSMNNNAYFYFTPKNRSLVNSYPNSEKKDFNRIVDDFSNKLSLNSEKPKKLTSINSGNYFFNENGNGTALTSGRDNIRKNPFVFLNEKTIKRYNETNGTINKKIVHGEKSKLGQMIEFSLRETPIHYNNNEMVKKINAKSDFEGYNKQETACKITEEQKLNPFKIPPQILEQSKYVVTLKPSNVVNEEPQAQLSSSTMTISNSCKYNDIKSFNTFDFSDVTESLSKRLTKIKLPNPDKDNLEMFYSNNPNKDIIQKEKSKNQDH